MLCRELKVGESVLGASSANGIEASRVVVLTFFFFCSQNYVVDFRDERSITVGLLISCGFFSIRFYFNYIEQETGEI